ncbi:cellulose-binding domain-containing protein [Rhizomonospora bruguierae]|uniref:cellulose-binding domain-containing protein n=1 Tax=Rhizomonospora bruguierae TaxID=1581705 RepID=UPI001BCECBF9|nr:cellulose-binding domain-containing protein [Micromonospora sp. NBRC 107566]
MRVIVKPRGRTRAAVVAFAAMAAASLVGTGLIAAPAAQAATGCRITYTVNEWTGGFTASVGVSGGDAAVNGWTVNWTYAGDQRITSAWNATVTQSGQAVTATNVAWNGSIPANGSTEFGFQGTFGAGNPAPTAFTLNGVACNGAGPTTPPTNNPPTTTPPTTRPPTTPPTTTPPTTTPPTTPPTTGNPAGCGSAAFCDGLESQSAGTAPSGNWSVVYPDCQGTGTATVDGSVAHSGSKSIRVNGGAGYCNHVFVRANKDLSTLGTVWYGRFWVRHSTALPATHVTFAAMRDAADGGRDLRMGGQNARMQWNRASDDATLPEQSPSGVALSAQLPVNTWNCVEFMVNGGQGTLSTWLGGSAITGLQADGVPTHDIDSQWYNHTWRPALTDLRVGWEGYGNDADTLWFDDVAVGSSRIGC